MALDSTMPVVCAGGDPTGMRDLAVAAAVFICASPSSVFDVGFQLSVLGVAGIVVFGRLASEWLRAGAAASCSVGPPTGCRDHAVCGRRHAAADRIGVRDGLSGRARRRIWSRCRWSWFSLCSAWSAWVCRGVGASGRASFSRQRVRSGPCWPMWQRGSPLSLHASVLRPQRRRCGWLLERSAPERCGLGGLSRRAVRARAAFGLGVRGCWLSPSGFLRPFPEPEIVVMDVGQGDAILVRIADMSCLWTRVPTRSTSCPRLPATPFAGLMVW